MLHHGPSASFPFPSNHTRPRAWQKQFQFDYKHSLLHGNTTQKRKGMVKRKNKNTAAHALAVLFFGFVIKGQTLGSVSCIAPHRAVPAAACVMLGRRGSTLALQRLIQMHFQLPSHCARSVHSRLLRHPTDLRSLSACVGSVLALFPLACFSAVGAADHTHCPPRDE